MRWLWSPLAVLGLLLAGLAVWNWLLSREIRRCRKAERDLRASQERFKTVMDNLPIGIAVNSVDPVVEFEYMNDNFSRFYRTTREALAKPDGFWDAVYEDPEFREEIRRRVLEGMSSGDPKRLRWEDVPIVRRGEPTTFITAQNTPLPDEGLTISTVLDVTERKTAEEAVRRSDERLRRFVEANVVGVVLADTTGRVLEANDYFLRIIGHSREELRRGLVDWRALTPPEWLSVDEKAIAELRVLGSSAPYEKEYVRRDGTRVSVFLSDVMIPGPEEQIVAFVLDITERKSVESALQRSEARFRELFDHMSGGVAVYEAVDDGADFVFRDLNPAAERIEKVRREDVIGRRVTCVFPGVEAFGIFEVFRRVWKSGEGEFFPEHVYKDERDPGSWRENWVFRLPSGEVVAVYNDISERKRAEAELIQKMEELRRFHELTVGREDRMIELKKEVNALLRESGRREKYRIVE